MSAEYSVEEVRAAINGFVGYSHTHHGIGGDLIGIAQAYANRIEADEGAVPVAWLSEGEGALESWQPTYIVGVDEESCREAVHESLVGWNPYRVFPVYTHPPAQPAQMDRARETPRRQQAVETLLELGWKYNIERGWEEPAQSGQVEKCCAMAGTYACKCNTFQSTAAIHPHSPDAADSGRVMDEVVERAASAFMRVRGIGMPRPWETMLESSRESYRPAFRAALEAALAAQPQSAASPAGVPDGLYRNACDSVESWKARALEAEETAERLVAAMNDLTGPTFMGEPVLTKTNVVPDANDLAQLKKAMEDWNDGVDTDVPQHALMRLAELKLLVAETFEVTKKGMDMLAAAQSATPEGGEVDRG